MVEIASQSGIPIGMNHFAEATQAERYARFRPYFHPKVVEKIGEITGAIESALDVGCGTGQSTLALLSIAESVIGVDPAEEMLRHCPRRERLTYEVASAEKLPFEDDAFELISAGLAFHWFDQPKFLREAARVLVPLGWLALYNDGFTGVMVEHPAYEVWHRGPYLDRFPAPPRNLAPANRAVWMASEFTRVGQADFDHDEKTTIEKWCGYLMTQSNVLSAIETGREREGSVRAWLMTELQNFKLSEPLAFRFHCRLDVYRNANKL